MSPSMTSVATPVCRFRRRAFSLIELLVVITIIAIVIAITVPAIGAARDLARGTATQSQIQALTTAVSSFQRDNDRVPGYFNAADMSDNQDGFTSMQNVILDLAGGPVDPVQGAAQSLPEVGPNQGGDASVFVNPALIGLDGANSTSYLAADAVEFQTVEGKVNGGTPIDEDEDNLLIPEIVDPWGMPILAWAENEFAPEISDLEDPNLINFAAESEMDGVARFYWEQNAPLLESNALGERRSIRARARLFPRLMK
jgi:prepilin-type N-terminal cleavage/methylation domain-containing protein